jgi:hypothetical protein
MPRHLRRPLATLPFLLVLIAPAAAPGKEPSQNPSVGTITKVEADRNALEYTCDPDVWRVVPHDKKMEVFLDGNRSNLRQLQARLKEGQLQQGTTKCYWERARGRTLYATKVEAFSR